MDTPSFKDALTASELKNLSQSPDKRIAYVLAAFLRTEGALLGAEDITGTETNRMRFIIDAGKELSAPIVLMNKDQLAYTQLRNGKYDWLKVDIDIDGIAIRVLDEKKLFAYFEELKKSTLLEGRLKRNLLEMANARRLSISFASLQNTYHQFGEEKTYIAGTKMDLWSEAALSYLTGGTLDTVCAINPETGMHYKTGDVLKAMDADMPAVRDEVYRIFKEMDTRRMNPHIRPQLEECKAELKKTEADSSNEFAKAFQLVEETSVAAQALSEQKKKEKLMKME